MVYKKIIISFIFSILIVVAFLLMPMKFAPNQHIIRSGGVYPIFTDHFVEQWIVPDYPLKGIRLSFKKINDIDHKASVAIGVTRDPKVGREFVYKSDFHSGQISEGVDYDFELAKSLPANNRYSFKLDADTASISASISPYFSYQDIYLQGEGQFRENINGDVSFKPIYQTNGLNIFKYYLNRANFNKPMPRLVGAILILSWVWLILFTVVFLVLRFINKKNFRQLIFVLLIIITSFLILFLNTQPQFILS